MERHFRPQNPFTFAMSLFNRPHYTSEITQFIDGLKKEHPELEAQQLEGRARLWDKEINRSESLEFAEARIAQKPYVYQTDAT